MTFFYNRSCVCNPFIFEFIFILHRLAVGGVRLAGWPGHVRMPVTDERYGMFHNREEHGYL
jgi:hypothetical protein